MLLTYIYRYSSYPKEEPSVIGGILVTLCILGILGSFLYVTINFMLRNKNNHYWERGIFPPNLKSNRNNLMEAYICMAALLINYDRRNSGEKIVYMKKYFNKYFPNNGVNISQSISISFKHPIRIKSVSSWLFKNVRTEKDKLQILYFLVGIAKLDGKVTAKEFHVIQKFSEYIKISKIDFERAVKNYKQEENKKQYQNTRGSSRSTYNPRKSRKKLACEVLGLPESATMKEIKSKYRKLVKIHHPDRFHNEPSAKQEIAEEKFLEIQKAYETLEKL